MRVRRFSSTVNILLTLIKTKEHRAVKHLARKDEVLVHAIMRVWKARERGKLLERVKTARIVKDAWAIWKRRIREQRDRESMNSLYLFPDVALIIVFRSCACFFIST
jgi:hypothetical protein